MKIRWYQWLVRQCQWKEADDLLHVLEECLQLVLMLLFQCVHLSSLDGRPFGALLNELLRIVLIQFTNSPLWHTIKSLNDVQPVITLLCLAEPILPINSCIWVDVLCIKNLGVVFRTSLPAHVFVLYRTFYSVHELSIEHLSLLMCGI